MIGIIYAQSQDGVIGDGQDMPWYLPEDLHHFKEITMNHPVFMGRKTWLSLPEPFRPLPGRENLVLTRSDPGAWSRGSITVSEIPQRDTLWIIGGGEVYNAYLDHADIIEVTVIDCLIKNDLGDKAVLAPEIPPGFRKYSDTGWMESEKGHLTLGGNYPHPLRYKFQSYRKP